MSRYLNPSKVCLLALVRLYQQGCVPEAAIPAILILLAPQIQSETGHLRRPAQSTNEDLSKQLPFQLSAIEAALAPYVVTLRNSDDETNQSCTLWQLFSSLVVSISNLDIMALLLSETDDMFLAFEESSQNLSISTSSPLGVFVRRVKVEFELLQFPEVMQLWHNFAVLRDQLPVAEDTSLIISLAQAGHPAQGLQSMRLEYGWAASIISDTVGKGGTLSTVLNSCESETILDFQIEQMQSKCYKHFRKRL